MADTWQAISLFAGAGGCSLGFRNAGIEILAAYDHNRAAIQTYNANFGREICQNVDLSVCDFDRLRDQLGLKRGELNLIIGGPPCQGFTTAGNRFWDDPRNKLLRNYVQALDALFPHWFMMENVEGILTTAQGVYLVECLKKMTELGYTVYLKKAYMQEYGIPQRRKRVIIIGNRDGKRFDFPAEKECASGGLYRKTSVTLRDAIGDLEEVEIPEIDHVARKETGLQLMRISRLKAGQSMKDLPEALQNQSFQRRAHRRVCDGVPSGKRGGPPAGMKRLRYDEPCLTITGSAAGELIHPVLNRTLTIRECARVQTFPDSFAFSGTDSQKMQQIGNAIPPQFAQQLARQILLCDGNDSGEKPASLQYCSVTKAASMSPALRKTYEMLGVLMPPQYGQISLAAQ